MLLQTLKAFLEIIFNIILKKSDQKKNNTVGYNQLLVMLVFIEAYLFLSV